MKTLQIARIALHRRLVVSSIGIFLIATLFGPGTASAKDKSNNSQRDIKVATINLYVGADFTPVLSLSPSDPAIIPAIVAVHDQILASKFEDRAEALAQQIVANSPDVVSLQEVTLLRRQSPGDRIFNGSIPATDIERDYLALLLDALARHGGHYAVASQIDETDVEVPLFTGSSFDDVRLTDRDVILVRTDVPPGFLQISNPQSKHFDVLLPLPIGGLALRGWCSIDVMVRGRSFRVIDTHLEDQLPPGYRNVQLAQAYELLAGPAGTTLPVILAGDFNSDANGQYSSETYALLTGQLNNQGRFTDAWTVAKPNTLGFTWGHDGLLADQTVPFIYRLDLVLYRGTIFKATEAAIADPLISASAPRWFSDHAAVFAALNID
jgi:endonuclease/exonuclease/phosphatase family metal-dependent hydrolase